MHHHSPNSAFTHSLGRRKQFCATLSLMTDPVGIPPTQSLSGDLAQKVQTSTLSVSTVGNFVAPLVAGEQGSFFAAFQEGHRQAHWYFEWCEPLGSEGCETVAACFMTPPMPSQAFFLWPGAEKIHFFSAPFVLIL